MHFSQSNLIPRSFFALALTLTLTSPAPYAVQARAPISKVAAERGVTVTAAASCRHIDNFQRVNSQLLRGAVPSAKGLKELRDAGVKTIVNLRGEDSSPDEEAEARALGLEYFNIPFGHLKKPDIDKISTVLNIIQNPQYQPVFVHCRQGADRTGMIVGIYRVLHDGWSFDRIYAEMRQHHFKPFFLTLKKTVQQFANKEYVYDPKNGVTLAGETPAGLHNGAI
ncbi:MAG TPA: tyrosine-protein phosphatase [Candidatus Obscuribacterales bacterium]